MIDTIVVAVVQPLQHLPLALTAIGMMAAQLVIHFPVPSTSGQAMLTIPLLVPLSDLLGLSRQVTVLAYQYGAGLCDLLTPTNGSLIAMLAAAEIKYTDWMRFVLPLYTALALLSVIAIVGGIWLEL